MNYIEDFPLKSIAFSQILPRQLSLVLDNSIETAFC